MPESFVKFSS